MGNSLELKLKNLESNLNSEENRHNHYKNNLGTTFDYIVDGIKIRSMI